MAIRLPGRLSAAEAAILLGMTEAEISVLVREGKLKALGSPRGKAAKLFSASEIEQLRDDPKWLSLATKIIQATWRTRNARSVAD